MTQLTRFALASLTLAAGLAGPAFAQAPPGWKIADICAHESAPGQCAAFEGKARNAVTASWPFVLQPIRDVCLAQTSKPADQSWRLLAECLDNASLKALDRHAVSTVRTPAEPVPPPRVSLPPSAPELTVPPAAPAPVPAAPAAPPQPAR